MMMMMMLMMMMLTIMVHKRANTRLHREERVLEEQ